MKITLCGNLNDSKEILNIKEKLEKKGFKIFTQQNEKKTIDKKLPSLRSRKTEEKLKHELVKKHHASIKKSDAILVINPKKYIDKAILSEMQLANLLEKNIYLLNPIPKNEYSKEIEDMKTITIKGDLSKIK